MMLHINPITNTVSSEYNSFIIPLLRNLTKKEHNYMLSKVIVNFDKRHIDGNEEEFDGEDASFEKVKVYYDNLIAGEPKILDAVEYALLSYIAHDSIDDVIIFNIKSESSNINLLLKSKQIIEDPLYMKKIYNQSIQNPNTKIKKSSELKLLTIRPKVSSNSNNSLLLLFSYGFYKTAGGRKSTILFSCVVNLDNSTLQLKYQSKNIKNLRSIYNTQMSTIIKEMITVITDKIPDIEILNDKSVTDYEENLYNLFNDLSNESEDIIKNIETNKDKSILDIEIQKFIHETLEVDKHQIHIDARKDELIKSYYNRILSIYYQNVAQKVDENLVFQSYIYAFVFLSNDSTRSSTSKGNNDAIYKDDIFWRLKDLIHSAKKVKSLSIFERFNKIDPEKVYTKSELKIIANSHLPATRKKNIKIIENTLSVDYKIETVHGGIKIHYNINKEHSLERGVKNEYVIGKIIKYL